MDNFITHLYCLAEYCEFGTRRDDVIRDRIVVGIKDKKPSEQLQIDSKLTLEKQLQKPGSQRQLKSSKPSYRKPNLTHHQLMLTVCPKERENILKKIRRRKRNHQSLKMGRLLKHNVQGAWVNHAQRDYVQPANQNVTSVLK